MAWTAKKYARINWKNRPSTATALGATNLNRIDAFCNDVDNALIEMDAGKLNVSVANSMIKSVSYNRTTGVWVFTQLDGTTYTFDQNIEKIPVSFSMDANGILTMVTEDGSQYEANIADLIKDYNFDDSETIGFTKTFNAQDSDGKGAYHVEAIVKEGSIEAKHLNPDYRANIQEYTNTAQTAANDSLQYSKDSKRWAVGDAEYEGSNTDNSKYYKEQAEAAKTAAEKARDEAQAATGGVIMAPGVLGVGKPDNTTIGVEEDGTIKMIAKAAQLAITDTQGLVGEANLETTTQLLINAIADRIVNQLVTQSSLTEQLANYVAKSMLSGVQVNDADHVPTSALAYAMQQAITQNANNITTLNSNMSGTYCSDLNVVKNGFTFLRYDGSTLNSPYKAGVTGVFQAGAVLSYGYGDYANQIAMPAGTFATHKIITRTKSTGTWSDWIPATLESEIKSGVATLNYAEANVDATVQVKFSTPFANSDYAVSTTIYSTNDTTWHDYPFAVLERSASGFSIKGQRTKAGADAILWMAIPYKS